MYPTEKGHILQELHDMVFVQQATLSSNFISKRYQVHISEASKLLEEFVKQHRKEGKLTVQYSVSGSDDCDDGYIRLHRFSIVDESELDSCKSMFVKPTYQVYSVNIVVNDQEPKSVLNFEQFIFEPNADNLSKVQSLTYIHNPHIKIRPAYREYASKNLKCDSFGKNETTTTTSTIEAKEKVKPEPMDVEVQVSKLTSLKKRSCSKEDTKRYKRIRVLDSDDEDEDVQMKENVQVKPDEEFKVTKLEKESPKSVKNEEDKNAKPKQTQSVLKIKTQTQTSIMSFFKKPSSKK